MSETATEERKCLFCEGTGIDKGKVSDGEGILSIVFTVFALGFGVGLLYSYLAMHMTIGWHQ